MSKIVTTKSFIEEVSNLHNNQYDYSLLQYKKHNLEVTIICKKHGAFQQTPTNHKRGKGCPQCALENRTISNTSTADIFILDSTQKHNNKYDYSQVKYTNSKTKVQIICPYHGVFHQTPSHHKSGSGCPDCAIKTSSLQEFINDSTQKHNNKYDYSLSTYISSKTKLTIICPDHGPFEQTPSKHKLGGGCPCCTVYGFKMNEPAIFYYVRINKDNHIAYKIGITNRTVRERFESDMQYITPIKEISCSNGQEAHDLEQELLSKFNEYKWNKENLLISGNTEMFTRDVLGLDL